MRPFHPPYDAATLRELAERKARLEKPPANGRCMLLELPAELVGAVLERVDKCQDRLSVSRTCKAIARLNERYMYRSVDLPLPRSSAADKYLSSIICFFDHMNQSLEKHVRVLNLTTVPPPPSNRSSVPDGSLLARLLSIFPQLTQFYFELDSDHSAEWLSLVEKYMNWRRPPTVSCLAQIHLDYRKVQGGIGLSPVARSLAWPRLRRLSVVRFVESDSGANTQAKDVINKLDRTGSSVEHLTLIDATMQPQPLDTVLRWTQKSLKTLILTWNDPHFHDNNFDGQALAKSLQQCASTLTDLTITLEGCLVTSKHWQGLLHPLASLVNLKSLVCDFKILSTHQRWLDSKAVENGTEGTEGTSPAPARSPADLLPPNLEKLAVHVRDPLHLAVVNYVDAFLDGVCNKALPRLKTIALEQISIDWVPEHLEFDPDYDTWSSSRLKAKRGAHIHPAGESISHGLKPKDTKFVPRKAELKEVALKAAKAGITMVPPSSKFWDFRFNELVVYDNDPFGVRGGRVFPLMESSRVDF